MDFKIEPADLEVLEVEPADFDLEFGLEVVLFWVSIEERWKKVRNKYEWLDIVQIK